MKLPVSSGLEAVGIQGHIFCLLCESYDAQSGPGNNQMHLQSVSNIDAAKTCLCHGETCTITFDVIEVLVLDRKCLQDTVM